MLSFYPVHVLPVPWSSPVVLYQVEVTGAAGTTGVSAARPVTPAGSVASGCVKAPAYRATPAMAQERRSGPAMRRSALVSVSVWVEKIRKKYSMII